MAARLTNPDRSFFASINPFLYGHDQRMDSHIKLPWQSCLLGRISKLLRSQPQKYRDKCSNSTNKARRAVWPEAQKSSLTPSEITKTQLRNLLTLSKRARLLILYVHSLYDRHQPSPGAPVPQGDRSPNIGFVQRSSVQLLPIPIPNTSGQLYVALF